MAQEQNIQQQAQAFLTLTEQMFGLIDNMVMDERPMNDGEYLTISRNFQQLRAFSQQFRTNTIYVEVERQQQRRARRQPPRNRKTITREEKLRHKDYTMCPKCKKVLTKAYMLEHRRVSETCRHIQHYTANASVKRAKVFGDDKNYWDKIVPIHEHFEIHEFKKERNIAMRMKTENHINFYDENGIFHDREIAPDEEEHPEMMELVCFKCERTYLGYEGNCCCGECCSYCRG